MPVQTQHFEIFIGGCIDYKGAKWCQKVAWKALPPHDGWFE